MARTTQKENPDDRRCIWMQAGVVDYKICDNEYRCEQCEFESAIHGESCFLCGMLASDGGDVEFETLPATDESRESLGQIGEYIRRMLAGCQVKLDRVYHQPYLWSRTVSAQVIQVGLNQLSARILQPVTRIILPEAGTQVRDKQLLGWIVRPGMFVPVHSPIAGTILNVNPALQEQGVASVLETEEPLFTLHTDMLEDESDERHNLSSYLAYCARAVRVIRRHMLDLLAGSSGPGLGPTLADGGEPEDDLQRILGPVRYGEIVHQVLGAGCSSA